MFRASEGRWISIAVQVLAIRAENQMTPDRQESNPSMGPGQAVCVIGMDGFHNGTIPQCPKLNKKTLLPLSHSRR